MNCRPTILIIDDAVEDRKVYRRYLESAPGTLLCSIIEAGSGEEALALRREHQPDCVLLDYYLPDYDGLSLLEVFARDPSLHKPQAVLVLTGAGDIDLAVRTLKHGVQDYLDKDRLSAEQLRRAVVNAMEKVQLQTQLAREREWFRATLASLGEGIIATDSASWVLFMNEVASHLTGWPLEEAKGRALDEIFHAVNGASRRPVRFAELHGYGGLFTEVDAPLLLGRGGQEVPIDISSAPIRNAAEEAIGMVLVVRDRTERVQHQRAQWAQNEQLRVLLGCITEAVITIDADGRIERLNATAETLTGWTAAEVCGRSLPDVLAVVDEHRQLQENLAVRCLRQRHMLRATTSKSLRCRDGSEIGITDAASPIIDPQGALLGAVYVFRPSSAQGPVPPTGPCSD